MTILRVAWERYYDSLEVLDRWASARSRIVQVFWWSAYFSLSSLLAAVAIWAMWEAWPW